MGKGDDTDKKETKEKTNKKDGKGEQPSKSAGANKSSTPVKLVDGSVIASPKPAAPSPFSGLRNTEIIWDCFFKIMIARIFR